LTGKFCSCGHPQVAYLSIFGVRLPKDRIQPPISELQAVS